MKPRTAIIILIILSAIVLIAMYFIYQNSRQQAQNSQIKNQVANQQSEELSPEEKAIQTKIAEKREAIEKRKEEIKKSGYTQAELDFIFNPRKIVAQELGLATSTDTKK